ncbi:PucR family transcriptional regulator ligand-binding domain-containing protein [Paenibacillus sp. WQ 127069]|uniref:PucR family transcriptional regulator ligand-binding domain-containing protein n=1 Tax=Paenibacillus baimaensis TaxID=2982185 RepID=A0ABT2UA10_9BACL|nr:PucR family transcriptional regulator [Paenibacillus sp. WQ 127069]MCU6791016.1 PucR family transcriptional regulator ligand-binding domain-containing protein [Paenibacillus sp. WQ 127069]
MGVSVKDAMQIGGLVKCKVVAGEKGLHKTIDYITVMEVPDVIRWLKGNDLLLTSLYPIKDDEEAIGQLVQQLHAVGSSALAIKTERYVKQIPAAIIEAGNRLDFPIIEIDDEVSYLDIMTPLMERSLNQPDLGKEQLEKSFQWITELAMGGKGIPALVEAVQQMTENIITVGSEMPNLEGISSGSHVAPLTRSQKNELKIAKRSIRMERMLNHLKTPCIVTPLLLNDELYGDVTCWQTKREFVERDFLVLDRTILLMALEFLKVITKADVEQNFKDDLLTEVLLGNITDKTEVINKGRMFNWDLAKDYQVFAITFTSSSSHTTLIENEALWFQERKRKMLRKVNDIFRFNAILTIRKEHIIVLYHCDGTGAPEYAQQQRPHKSSTMDLAESAYRQLSQEFEELQFTLGIGRFYQGLEGIHEGYKEAVKAIQLGKPISGATGCVHYEDLGIYRVLGQVSDWKEMEELYSETIGKLVEYDWSNNATLADTLREYFASNCSLSESAEKLFVHVNTMKYRLQKIEQLTGCNVHDAEKRLLLHMGLKIDQLLQSGNI